MIANILAAFAVLFLALVAFGVGTLIGLQLLPLGLALAALAWLASRIPGVP
jgi:hypothetical protein